MSIAGNLKIIRERIASAAGRVGRDPDEITIVAVTKTVDPARIREALREGIRIFGENRVQEARDKIADIGRDVSWHMIGHLQTNKVKSAVSLFDEIHSVDSLRLARELDREAGKQGKKLPVLVQVSLAGEAQKFGIEEKEVFSLIRVITGMDHLKLMGLMTIPPFYEDPEKGRPIYRRLRRIRDQVVAMGLPGVEMEHLSMGMSHDYQVAVEEGATRVRIGSAIFGERR